MLNSPIFAVAAGVIFLFGVLATLTTAITEVFAWWYRLRQAFLMRGLLALVDGTDEAKGLELQKLLKKPVLSNQGSQTTVDGAALAAAHKHDRPADYRKIRHSWPPYIPARTFSAAVMDRVLEDPDRAAQPGGDATTTTADGAVMRPTMDDIESGLQRLSSTDESQGKIFSQQLTSLAQSSMGDIKEFRRNVENWFDDHMERVSGWYKNHTRWITAGVGLVIVVGLNVQVFAFADSLYTSQALSRAVVSEALSAKECTSASSAVCVERARNEVQALEPTLAVGWTSTADCRTAAMTAASLQGKAVSCSFWEKYGFTNGPGGRAGWGDFWAIVEVVLGYLLTVLALIPGSRFWFDMLNRLGSLRSVGPKPASSSAK